MQITADLLNRSWRSWWSNDMRRVGPEWLQVVWTVAFAAAVGLGFTVLGVLMNPGAGWTDPAVWWRWYRVNFVISLCVALCIHGLFAIVIPWVTPARIRRFSNPQRAAFFIAVPVIGMAIGWPLGVWLVSDHVGGWIRISREGVMVSAVLAAAISAVFYFVFSAMAKRYRAEQRATEAQLRLLQGQIEPHFLFNTLANVHSLMEHDPPLARQMLEDFTEYLRSSLGTLRSDSSTLAHELELARRYLQLQQRRMEDRLRFEIDADAALLQHPLPPLLLQPLVENAVVHGLEPSLNGGTVRVSAHTHGGHLQLQVQDDGCGLQTPRRGGASRGNGMALDNIRQRLQSHWGDEASLTLSDAAPGTRACLTLPLDHPAP